VRGAAPRAAAEAWLAAVERLLAGLPGIRGAQRVGRDALERVAAEEGRYEKSAFLPLKNEGVRQVLERQAAVAVLKDRHFREPPSPTVYLVERINEGAPVAGSGPDGAGPEGATGPAQVLEVGGVRYRILGEEVLGSRRAYAEKTLFLADSFVLFPERRASPARPSFFLIPPLGFPELELRQEELGVCRIISISPSSQSDLIVREACGFPGDTALATLLVGFDRAAGATRGRAPNDPGSRAKP
jgi:hypothetical protein